MFMRNEEATMKTIIFFVPMVERTSNNGLKLREKRFR